MGYSRQPDMEIYNRDRTETNKVTSIRIALTQSAGESPFSTKSQIPCLYENVAIIYYYTIEGIIIEYSRGHQF